MNVYIISSTWVDGYKRTNHIFLYKSRAEEVCKELNEDEKETGIHYSIGTYPVNEEHRRISQVDEEHEKINPKVANLEESKITIDGVEYELTRVVPKTCETCRYCYVAWDKRVIRDEACQWCVNYNPNYEDSSLMWKRKDNI